MREKFMNALQHTYTFFIKDNMNVALELLLDVMYKVHVQNIVQSTFCQSQEKAWDFLFAMNGNKKPKAKECSVNDLRGANKCFGMQLCMWMEHDLP